MGLNPSYIWRSVFYSMPKLKEGCRCRVGDGSKIQIFHDAWLSKKLNPRIVSASNPYIEDQKVSFLLDMEGASWDPVVVKDLFNGRDQALIFSIPISTTRREDTMTWG
ncbi:hypothetical protein Syun_025593 [Stephania yunnanensis]|uniref:Uncharacterized protein n=1 Tax=Stephania yunnanensis TaxID=152371 RepID=A0AAP0HRE4_9MAGN